MFNIRSTAAYPIAVSYAAIFAWVLLLLGSGVYFVADAEFRRQQDREIVEELDRLIREPNRRELFRELAWRKAQDPAYRYSYALFDRGGKSVFDTLGLRRPVLGLSDLRVSSGDDGIERVTRGGAKDLSDGSRLVVAVNSDAIDGIKERIVRLFLMAAMAIFAFSAIGAVLLGRYLRKLLEPINTTAKAIIAGEMDWRVPVGKRGNEFDTAGHAVNLMLERIDGLMENLRQVSSDIAHDLRKPLMRLLVQTDRLGNVEGAERVLELGDELLVLFSGILRIAEVEGGELERNFVPVDLSSAMVEVAESFAPAISDEGDTFDWDIEPDVIVMGSRELLAQLAANLIDNALTHTPMGTAIYFRLASQGEEVVITVEDNGPGVADVDRTRLLQRFFRTEASRTTEGNGLGLSLAAAVAKAHRGAIALEDADPGLRVLVRLQRL